MSSMDLLDVGQANELKLACRRNGFTPDDLKWLCQGTTLSDLIRVRRGEARFVKADHLIRCDQPYVPAGLELESHRVDPARRRFLWKPENVTLLYPGDLECSWGLTAREFEAKLESRPVMNACILNYLMRYQHLIPEHWKDKTVYFWGTTYRLGNLRFILCLFWEQDHWRSCRVEINNHVVDASTPAAMFRA